MYFTSPYVTVKSYTEKEMDTRIREHERTGRFELVAKKKVFEPGLGKSVWYAKLKRIDK